jgi:hypothetical protein
MNFNIYKNSGWGISKLGFQKLFEIIDTNKNNHFNIIEFGSGISTQFLIDCAILYKNIKITSFDNDINYSYKQSKDYDFFNLKFRNLVECSDLSYNNMFNEKKYDKKQMKLKTSEPTTRQKNCFYDLNENDLVGQYDLVILDGPNGNGRNLAFLHLINHVKSGTYFFVDDYNHYDFIDKLKSIYLVNEIYRNIDNSNMKWDNGGNFMILKVI